MPPLVHVLSDDPEFDPTFLSALQAEGFQTTYTPLLPPKTKPTSPSLDLHPLNHIADDLEPGESYALVAFGAAATACLDFYAANQPHIAALVAYYPPVVTNPLVVFPPRLRVLTHLAASQGFAPAWPCYTYPDVEPGFAERDLDEYERVAAGLAWSRTLGVLREALGVRVDLEGVWEEFAALAATPNATAAAMRTMVSGGEEEDEPHVNHVPTMTGGTGQSDLALFHELYLTPRLPTGSKTTLLTRTINATHLIDELHLTFTHSSPTPWLLPGVPPTHKKVEIALVMVVGFRGGKICHERVYWDQASVLVQVGLLDPRLVPDAMRDLGVGRLPVVGGEGARMVLDPRAEESNGLLDGWGEGRSEDTEEGMGMPVRPKAVETGR